MTDAEKHLRLQYERWRTLTVAEGQAIRGADWTRVADCQAEKAQIQLRISALEEDLAKGFSACGDSPHGIGRRPARQADHRSSIPRGEPSSVHAGLHSVLREVILLEQRNLEDLHQQQGRARQQSDELHQASRRLSQVHRAYAPGGREAWHLYS